MVTLGNTTTIGPTPVAGRSYSWTSIPAGFTSDIANPTVSPHQETEFILTETVVATGCSNSSSIVLSIQANPPTFTSCPSNQPFCSANGSNYTIAGTSLNPTATADAGCVGGLSSLTYSTDVGVSPSTGSSLNGAVLTVGAHTITWTATDCLGKYCHLQLYNYYKFIAQ